MIDDMEINDYVMYDGKVVKIIGESYEVLDTDKNANSEVRLIQPNILISEDILQMCGFEQKQDEKNVFTLEIKGNTVRCVIDYDITPLKDICSITIYFSTSLKPEYAKMQIMVLSELQDFVRKYAKQELKIDHKKLVELVKQQQ